MTDRKQVSHTRGVVRRAIFVAALFASLFSIFSIKAFAGEPMTYWIDVRTQEEFNSGHIEGSALIPYEVIADHIASITEDKNADIRVYCRSGRRSEVAKDVLKAMGYANVINEGGYEEIISRK
ncbi:rhodanese-like domain-containing protein [Marinagarivorans cellulosilyticus]|uniref:Phage shock protein E n=1 Tax=Marinagarivorans cellulosilyticus TaxID=2721545 RepID=A0AAN2BLF5_9GAMM|nr:rhodanese-like domain-containing protein [Marinagarivorans cellulosilyticus]BCD99034.1 phage shock protein E [Marinagarivorans cellulosilyticus]